MVCWGSSQVLDRLVCFAFVDLQPLVSLWDVFAFITWEGDNLTGILVRVNYLKRRGLLFQELLPAPLVSSQSGWAGLLLGPAGQGLHALGVPGEGEVWTNADGHGEGLALVGQRLADGQALCCQGGVLMSHISHFLVKSELSDLKHGVSKTCHLVHSVIYQYFDKFQLRGDYEQNWQPTTIKVNKKCYQCDVFLQIYAYRNSRVFGDEFVNKFGESLNLVKLSVKISVTILVLHQIWWWFQWQFWAPHQI